MAPLQAILSQTRLESVGEIPEVRVPCHKGLQSPRARGKSKLIWTAGIRKRPLLEQDVCKREKGTLA